MICTGEGVMFRRRCQTSPTAGKGIRGEWDSKYRRSRAVAGSNLLGRPWPGPSRCTYKSWSYTVRYNMNALQRSTPYGKMMQSQVAFHQFEGLDI